MRNWLPPSAPARSTSCGLRHAVGPTGRSPHSSISVRAPSRTTSPASSAAFPCATALRRHCALVTSACCELRHSRPSDVPLLALAPPVAHPAPQVLRGVPTVKLWRHHAAQGQADRSTELAAERKEPWLKR
ncbi:conserved hypothetical protein [Streptomyces sviceus ATCC 29083]|uniref:Uncharacterized protein n=1 Tax=Streptomyces sviceus (strain ATCC 29083 / DSM 924 / JCM 4929 / NBRC 13980 / NCIMB 11184 / NRRL 5439 / UC 5370) TaxID=463191 RepID=B5HS06_STRX2|nr:conserved hypothetical protein [Streptomyces sviceus ATCC 29083]